MKYSSIRTIEGTPVPHSTIRGLALAIQHKSQKDGKYLCTCLHGNKHTWEFTTKIHVAVGRAKGKVRIGAKAGIPNAKAKLVKVERV